MTAPLLLVTEVPVTAGNAAEAVRAWRAHAPEAALYEGVEAPTVLELTPLDSLSELDAATAGWETLTKALSPLADGDIRRQVLQFVEAPKPVEGALPDTPYVQLRHVEVKLPVLAEYLTWRDGTIFDVVRTSPDVEGFLAYHSLLSTEPGIMFVSGFSCEPEQYNKPFQSERYAEIAKYAHSKFVTESGLYTRVYRRVPR